MIATLADAKGQEAFNLLKEKYKDDEYKLHAVKQYDEQFKTNLKNQSTK